MSIIQSSAVSSWASMKELKCDLKDREEPLPNGHSCTEGFGNGSALVAEQSQPFVFQAQSFAKVKAVDSMTVFMNQKGGKAMHEPCEKVVLSLNGYCTVSNRGGELTHSLHFIMNGCMKHKCS